MGAEDEGDVGWNGLWRFVSSCRYSTCTHMRVWGALHELTTVHSTEPVAGCDVGEVTGGEVAVGLEAELLSEAGFFVSG